MKLNNGTLKFDLNTVISLLQLKTGIIYTSYILLVFFT